MFDCFNYVIISIKTISLMSSIENKEVEYMIRLLKQKFISPYKIIYMIDQK